MKPVSENLCREIYCVDAVPPEQMSHAMARYSRSSQTFKESILDVMVKQNSGKFHELFSLGYGHNSIKDMAYVSIGMDNVSLLAEMEIVNERLWAGQARSTRYQDYAKTGYITPKEVGLLSDEEQNKFHSVVQSLFSAYQRVYDATLERLMSKFGDKREEKELKAKAFDVARYLLPLCAATSVGQQVSARTLEKQIPRLLISPYPEIRRIAEDIRKACAERPTWTPLGGKDPLLPTLLKYTEPDYRTQRLKEKAMMFYLARESLLPHEGAEESDDVRIVVSRHDALIAVAKCLYENSHYPFSKAAYQLIKEVNIEKVLGELLDGRGPHDPAPHYFSGGPLNFDILMDIGGLRDLYRHRNMAQFRQGITTKWGFAYDYPILNSAKEEVDNAIKFSDALTQRAELGGLGHYVLPLGMKRRSLLSMDVAQAIYMIELRSRKSGHYSYVRIAQRMYEELKRASYSITPHINVTTEYNPLDTDLLHWDC